MRVGKRLELRARHEDLLVRAREDGGADRVVLLEQVEEEREVGVELGVERVRRRLVEHAAATASWRSTVKKRGWGGSEFKRSFGSVRRVCQMTVRFRQPDQRRVRPRRLVVLPATVLKGRAVAGGDEDAVTLAAEAALPLLAAADAPPVS